MVETLEVHLIKHYYPKTKRRCTSILEKCSFTNPATSKKESWLGRRNGYAICIVCNSCLRELQSGAQDDVSLIFRRTLKRSYLATGTGYNLNIVDPRLRDQLRKHNRRLGHTKALEAYYHRLRAQAEFVPTFATGALAASAPQAASAQAA